MSNPVNRRRGIECVRDWNQHFPSGTKVVFEGREAFTDSPAALGVRDVPSVFLRGIEEPVPLDRLDVPGWQRTTRKKKASVPK